MKDLICKVMGISQASYYRWKEERPVINLLEKYCTEDDLEEFLSTGRISKFERNIEQDDDMKEFILKNAISKIQHYGTIPTFSFGKTLKEIFNKDNIEAVLSIKILLNILDNRLVTDLDSYYLQLEKEEMTIENSRNIIRDFSKNVLSKIELKELIKNKKYVSEYAAKGLGKYNKKPSLTVS